MVAIWDRMTGKAAPPRPRLQHYFFAHKVLPSRISNADSVLGILANPDNQEFLVHLWHQIGQGLSPSDCLSPSGLKHSSHWIGDEHLVILVELPPAIRPTEAHFVAITTSPTIRYLTFEASGRSEKATDSCMFCEWTAGVHVNRGGHGDPTGENFLHLICGLLSVPETIAPPTYQQREGMQKGSGTVIYGGVPAELPSDSLEQVKIWIGEGQAAVQVRNYERAERLFRCVLDRRMAEQGSENTLATMAHHPVVDALRLQGKHEAAEMVCRDWWKLCRRYRMLGHGETMLAIRVLAECLIGQNRVQDAKALMTYRAMLAGLARGAGSPIAQQARAELQSVP
jgi:hypothetical protein